MSKTDRIASLSGSLRHLHNLPRLINIMRVCILIGLTVLYVLMHYGLDGGHVRCFLLPVFHHGQFYIWVMVYALFIVFSFLRGMWADNRNLLPYMEGFADIGMMVWLMYIAGGVNSGLGILVLVFVTISCLLGSGRYPFLYAGYASCLIIACSYFGTRSAWETETDVWAKSVILAAAVFLVAAVSSFMAGYVARSYRFLQHQAEVLDSYKNLTEIAFDNAQEGIVVLDIHSRVWLMNRKAKIYFPPLEKDRQTHLFPFLLRRWQHKRRRAFVTEVGYKNRTMRVRAVPLENPASPLLMLFFRNNTELEQEGMSIKLAALGQLTANLAHEIRNPMSAIRQAGDLLREDNTDPETAGLCTIIDDNIRRIDKMLQEVGVLNKSDKVQKEAFDLMAFWRSFKAEFLLVRPEAAGCIGLSVGDGRYEVVCDRMQLQQIMWNLMNNAWRHSRKGPLAIGVSFAFRGGMEIAVTVHDDGPGVSEDVQLRLFEPFFTTEPDGTGLGLYVARELAQMNMGRLTYLPEVNGFEVVLPRRLNDWSE